MERRKAKGEKTKEESKKQIENKINNETKKEESNNNNNLNTATKTDKKLLETKILLAFLYMLFACCLNAITLEYVVVTDKKCGTMLSFCHFVALTFVGFFNNSERISYPPFLTLKKRIIPLTQYFIMVIFFSLASMASNLAFSYYISLPLHTVIRSGSMIVNIILTTLIQLQENIIKSSHFPFIKLSEKFKTKPYHTLLGFQYTKLQILSVIVVTIGIVITTLASMDTNSSDSIFEGQILGILLLIVAITLSTYLGIFQEKSFREYGKAPDENIFYMNLLSIPICLIGYSELIATFERWNSDPFYSENLYQLTIMGYELSIPLIWFFISLNICTQFMCVNAVLVLLVQTNSLTLQLALSIRKFISVFYSIIYFQHAFYLQHWVGTFLVFCGSYVFVTQRP